MMRTLRRWLLKPEYHDDPRTNRAIYPLFVIAAQAIILALQLLFVVAILCTAAPAFAADTRTPTPAVAVDVAPAVQALGALNAACTITLQGTEAVGFQLAAGTLVGTIVPEVSYDGGTTWVSTFFDDPTTSNKASSIVFGSSNTATARTIVGAGGISSARVRVSAFTSGTANCSIRANIIDDPSVLSAGADNSTAPPTTMQIGGVMRAKGSAPTTGTAGNIGVLITDTEHRLLVSQAHPNYFNCALDSKTASAQCIAAPASNSYYITDVYIQTATAQTLKLVFGTGTTCATGITTVMAMVGTTTGAPIVMSFQTPYKTTALNAICVTSSSTGAFNATVSGFIGP